MSTKKLIVAGYIILSLFLPQLVKAVNNDTLSVVAISGNKPGYSLYWENGKGLARIERSDDGNDFTSLGETTLNHFVDFNIKKDITYSYRVNVGGKTLTSGAADLSSGKSIISDIKIEAGVTNKAESSVVLNFKTDKLSKSQIFYGETMAYSNQTEIDNSLNQSHTVLIEKLKPNTTYHFKIRTIDKNDKNPTESDDQVFTTPTPPNETTIFQIIIKALSQAFAGFESWFKG